MAKRLPLDPLEVCGIGPDGRYTIVTFDHVPEGEAMDTAIEMCKARGLVYVHCNRPLKRARKHQKP